MSYPDGHNPPEGTMERFIEMSHRTEGGIAVHCMAGLGKREREREKQSPFFLKPKSCFSMLCNILLQQQGGQER